MPKKGRDALAVPLRQTYLADSRPNFMAALIAAIFTD